MHVHERFDKVLAAGGRKVDVDIEWPEGYYDMTSLFELDYNPWDAYVITRLHMAGSSFVLNVTVSPNGTQHMGLTWVTENGYNFISAFSCDDVAC